MALTKQQTSRIVQAIDETERGLERAMRYSEQFRDQKLIAFYNAHLTKLRTMLETDTWIS